MHLLRLIVCLLSIGPTAAAAEQTVWLFDNLHRIGGFAVRLDGEPRLVDAEVGKALQFDGVDDSILIDGRPLVGATTFTIEAVFRPDGGRVEQRFLHIAETDPASGLDALPGSRGDPNARFMFEVRVVGEQWYIDGFVKSAAGSRALAPSDKLHALARWYAVAQTFDGKMYRVYVNGALEAEAPVTFSPHGPGRVRVGARMNQIDHFKGAIAKARFTDEALSADQLLQVPL
jgi:hypothetical protein